ncbi:hypothetical protein BD311DRAFT_256312 [Dichomitus squalens]|uniref:Uncharacterized protein n=1 Tax=Dichomitus squalens TaxID=114155 RepID=A0A4Q9MQ29_9APHY|nr:hypothetical protein BD311DRAFT_256312 [Dichomitus squalens]
MHICLFSRASLATGIRVVQSSVCRHNAIGIMWAYFVYIIFWQTGSSHKSNCIPKCTHLRATAGANVRRRRVVGFWAFVVVTYSSSGTPPSLHALRPAPTQQQTWVRSCSHPDAWVHIVRRGVSGVRPFVTVSPFRCHPTEQAVDLSLLRGAAVETSEAGLRS